MADYKWTTNAKTICSGYEGESIGTSPILGWTDGNNAGGSQITTHWFQNRDRSSAKTQTINMDTKTTWTVTWDSHNYMKVNVSVRVNSVSASVSSGGNNTVTRHIVFRPYEGGAAAKSFDYNPNATGSLTNAFDIANWTLN